MLLQAFKEWAVICRALASGRQSLILRKGGIAEPGDRFQPEHSQFWLYPTYLHQKSAALQQEALPLLKETQRHCPAEGRVRIQHYAQVIAVEPVVDAETLPRMAPWHVWSEEEVLRRFRYRRPGLYALLVQIFEIPEAFEFSESSDQAGCKSWVSLENAPSCTDARPIPPAIAIETLTIRFKDIVGRDNRSGTP